MVVVMTRPEQRQFIGALVAAVLGDLMRDAGRVPEDWDGIELRQWIADRFQDSAYVLQRPENRRRYRDYKNVIATTGGL